MFGHPHAEVHLGFVLQDIKHTSESTSEWLKKTKQIEGFGVPESKSRFESN